MSTSRSATDAPVVVQGYLRAALAAIDEELGAGYAGANPQLVAAFVQACALESSVAVLADELGDGFDTVGTAVSAVSTAVAGLG